MIHQSCTKLDVFTGKPKRAINEAKRRDIIFLAWKQLKRNKNELKLFFGD